MCKEGYVRYRCGCIGRQLGLEECRYRKRVKELKAAGLPDSDVNVITNQQHCGENSGDKYVPNKEDCRMCKRDRKKK